MLAALLVDANVVISADRLVEVLWDDEPPARASSSVQKLVYRLRSLLGPGTDELVVTRAHPVTWCGSTRDFDAARFEGLAVGGRMRCVAGDAGGRTRDAGHALGLWRGPAFGEFASAEFAR